MLHSTNSKFQEELFPKLQKSFIFKMNKSFVSLEVTAYGDTARADALSLEGGLDDALKAIKNRVHSIDSAGQGLQQVLATNLLALLQTIRLFTERGQAFAGEGRTMPAARIESLQRCKIVCTESLEG